MMRSALALLGALVLTAEAALGDESPPSDPELRKGEYLLRAAGCAVCHTDTENDGALLAGGRAINTPFGVFYSPNITPHDNAGIGAWSTRQFLAALARGEGPHGRRYAPVFPYTAYARMRREDMLAVYAYLQSVPAAAAANRAHQIPWFLRLRFANRAWQWLFFRPGAWQPDSARSSTWNRGAYLVEAVTHCAECHSPRNRLGAIIEDQRFSGTRDGPDGETAPNITPDHETGIGSWDRADLMDYLRKGRKPDGDYAGGLMAEVVDGMLAHLTSNDRGAIVTYLLALEPIRHRVADSASPEAEEDF